MAGATPQPQHLEVLNRELAAARAAERLAWRGRTAVWRRDSAHPALDRIVGEVAQSAADLLTHGDLARLRLCGGDDCGWLFEDTSRSGTRRWCDMRDCGNVAKVRRFRARRPRAGR
jgi:predicted RNA-binding Zn ribbon-like protein